MATYIITLVPGYTFTEGETITLDKLNQLGNPTINFTGTLSSATISDGSVTTAKLADDAVTGDKLDDDGDFTVNSLTCNYLTVNVTGTIEDLTVNDDATVNGDLTVAGAVNLPNGSVAIADIAPGASSTLGRMLFTDTGGTTISWYDLATLLGLIDPMTTRGDLIYQGASGPARLGVGTSGQFLSSDGTDPTWVSANPVSMGGPAWFIRTVNSSIAVATTTRIQAVELTVNIDITVTLPDISSFGGGNMLTLWLHRGSGIAGNKISVVSGASDSIHPIDTDLAVTEPWDFVAGIGDTYSFIHLMATGPVAGLGYWRWWNHTTIPGI